MARRGRAAPTTPTSDREAVLARLGVSRETAERLDGTLALLARWQGTINLVAPSTLPQAWTRHVLDSAQLLPLLGDTRVLLDMGSGAGFPGLVLAILLADRPDAGTARVHLVESDTRKAAFLREAARLAGAPATIHPARVEAVMADPPGGVGLVTARALAPLPTLLTLAGPLLARGAGALFLKGQEAAKELTESGKSWTLDASLIPSLTEPDARIVQVRSATPRTIGPHPAASD